MLLMRATPAPGLRSWVLPVVLSANRCISAMDYLEKQVFRPSNAAISGFQ